MTSPQAAAVAASSMGVSSPRSTAIRYAILYVARSGSAVSASTSAAGPSRSASSSRARAKSPRSRRASRRISPASGNSASPGSSARAVRAFSRTGATQSAHRTTSSGRSSGAVRTASSAASRTRPSGWHRATAGGGGGGEAGEAALGPLRPRSRSSSVGAGRSGSPGGRVHSQGRSSRLRTPASKASHAPADAVSNASSGVAPSHTRTTARMVSPSQPSTAAPFVGCRG
ncbi:hypothetical protein [Streptomyces sp. CS014]|uniref:hypothetical protein n=1 Tax=Streptomyces sp. CS014 TaxID=2162707 RepID=UPI001EF6591F|nr:hypothetical protein [Streptomyces sp. CS014]